MPRSLPALAVLVALAGCSSAPETQPEEPTAPPTASEPLRLIAHRGGVVGDAYAENSPAALEAAVRRGYWMIEVDIRESADGALVVHHDEDFRRFYDDPRRVAEMTWDQIAALRAKPGASRPMRFAELCELARGRLRLMLDVKPPEHSDAFFTALDEALAANDLLESAYVIGTEQCRERYLGRAKVGAPLDVIEQAAAAGENVAERYFLFEHGRDLDAGAVRAAQALGVAVVPSINIFHYSDLPDHMTAAETDVRRMLDLGVSEFQIDSPYDVWLR